MRNPVILAKQKQRMCKYTEEDLLNRLLAQAKQLGRTPTTREVVPGEETYRRWFGSYTAAVLAAKLTPNVALPKQYLVQEGRSSIPLALRFEVLQRDGFRCRYCGGTPEEGYVLQVDHIVPVSRGGKNESSNLAAACWLCNSGKSDHN